MLRDRPSFRRERNAECHQAASARQVFSVAMPVTRARSSRPGAAGCASRTGAKCSLWPDCPASVSTRTRPARPGGEETLGFAWPASRKRAARSLRTGLGHGGHAGGGCAGTLAVGEDVQVGQFGSRARSAAFRRTARRSRSESRRSGRRRWRSRGAGRGRGATTARASARRWRRRMRFRIRSLPACSDRCRCGISRGSSAISRHRSSSIAAGSIEDSRRRGSSGTASQHPADHLAERRRRRADRGRRRRCRRRSARLPGSRPATSVRTCSAMAPIGTERLGPRPNGMMQKVQRWSQPCCTCTNARARLANSVTRCAAVSRAAMMSETAEPAPGSQLSGLQLVVVAQHAVHVRQRGPGGGIDLGGAAGDDDAGLRPFAGDACGWPGGPGVPPRRSRRRC